MQNWIRCMQACISLSVVLTLTGSAFAESWVLWSKTSVPLDRKQSTPYASVGIHESKAVCLPAAKQKAFDMRESKIRIDRIVSRSDAAQLFDKKPLIDAGERDEPGPLKNGQGYMTIYERPARTGEYVSIHYFFVAECWPVGVTPQ